MIHVEGHIANNVIYIFIHFHLKIGMLEQNFKNLHLLANLKLQEITTQLIKMDFMYIQEILLEIILHYIKTIETPYMKGHMKISIYHL